MSMYRILTFIVQSAICLLLMPTSVVAQNLKEPEMIDMGGSVLWASFNLYANEPTETGIYCGWGDPTGKLRFQASDPNGENYIETEACLAMYGGIDPVQNISGSEIDIVHRQMGNGWQMPRKKHFEELHDCKWELIRKDEVLGYKVTANNGNSIFLPAWNNNLGSYNGVDVAYGCYWTSEYSTMSFTSEESHCFNFVLLPWWLKSDDYDLGVQMDDGSNILMTAYRWEQLMIRPVKPKVNLK